MPKTLLSRFFGYMSTIVRIDLVATLSQIFPDRSNIIYRASGLLDTRKDGVPIFFKFTFLTKTPAASIIWNNQESTHRLSRYDYL
jgi:hypothetical protein